MKAIVGILERKNGLLEIGQNPSLRQMEMEKIELYTPEPEQYSLVLGTKIVSILWILFSTLQLEAEHLVQNRCQ